MALSGSGTGRTVREEVEAFADVFGTPQRPIPIVHRPELEDKKKGYYFDISKAKVELGWEPTYSHRKILRDYDHEVAKGRFVQ
jgi:nucleoside-diphosphate-sugar epimerase